ncbi:Tetratricopeptide repeat-containing protein [Verrucomicrobium sp. GAS474]|uniref:tetratricopeptide repeat protein n=1 Tax=Verrucomicrobium sp. GAS474 TaxID=1882831 RepID=UPI00087CCFFC|nr:tetratricopeptide repeat protein [Verrucomicrobium sp. GAS474]SDU06087.1 Tetratricopeptide repeat-containing protein [Verrucomicrobium sp. GAS474]
MSSRIPAPGSPAPDHDAPVLFAEEAQWNPAVVLWTIVALIVLGGVAVVGWRWSEARTAAKTEAFLGTYVQTKDNVTRLGLLEANGSLPAVVGEALPLGATLLQTGEPVAAAKAYLLAAEHAKGPLLGTALLGAAQALAEQGKPDEAVALLRRLVTEKGTEGSRPLALLLTSRFLKVKGDAAGSKQALQELKAKYGTSPFASEADELLKKS